MSGYMDGRDGAGLPRAPLGLYPTPLHRLELVSRRYGREVWIKRDDLCGVALGGNKVRKLEFLLGQARAEGCNYVITTGGAQSNHAALTAACAGRLGMKCILMLKKRGVMDYRGNLVLDDLFGVEKVQFVDTDDYQEIYAKMEQTAKRLALLGSRCFCIPVGGSTPLGAVGYAGCVQEMMQQLAQAKRQEAAGEDRGPSAGETLWPEYIVSATGSGGTTAGLLLGAKRFARGEPRVIGVAVDSDPFDQIVPRLAAEAAELLGMELHLERDDLQIVSHVGPGYAVANPEDAGPIRQLAHDEGILLDPVYTGKAWSGLIRLLENDRLKGTGPVVFVHTGGAPGLFAIDIPRKQP